MVVWWVRHVLALYSLLTLIFLLPKTAVVCFHRFITFCFFFFPLALMCPTPHSWPPRAQIYSAHEPHHLNSLQNILKNLAVLIPWLGFCWFHCFDFFFHIFLFSGFFLFVFWQRNLKFPYWLIDYISIIILIKHNCSFSFLISFKNLFCLFLTFKQNCKN